MFLACGMRVCIPVYTFLYLHYRPLEPYRTHTWAVPDFGQATAYSRANAFFTQNGKGALPGNLLSQACFIGRVAKRLEGKGYECSKEPIYWSHGEGKSSAKKNTSKKQKQFIVLTCNGMTVPWDFTLAAVRQWMWKKPEDLHIEYSFRSSSDSIVLPKIKIPV